MIGPVLDRAEAPPASLLLRRVHLLDPRAGLDEPADLLVRGGLVAEIGAPGTLPAPAGIEVIEAEGLHAFPAFVDAHVHLRTPGREDAEDIATGTAAAAAGGFGQIVGMANTEPPVDQAESLRALRGRARLEAIVPTGFAATVTRGLRGESLTEMVELAEAGAVLFSDDGRPVVDARVLRLALQYQRIAGRVIALHEEDPALTGDGVMHEGAVSARLGVAGIPSVAESTMIARDAALAGYEDAQIHIQHLSARASVGVVEAAKAGGVALTSEVCPHHLVLTDADVADLDANRKMYPPLRNEADRQALLEGLRDGTIDAIATDHAPHPREEKDQPFEVAPNGVIGLETAFPILYTELVRPGVLTLELVVERLTASGAPFGLPVPGLVPDAPAELCLVDLEEAWTVGEAGYVSRSANSAFAGRRVSGRVKLTVAGGSVAHREPARGKART